MVIFATCVVVAGLAAALTLTSWNTANQIATVASALGAVAAVGVAVWAALPRSDSGPKASHTGSAIATGPESRANTGVIGTGTGAADRTGNAKAVDGGSANSGVERKP